MKKLAIAIAVAALAGCVYKGAKITEGTDVSLGMSVPGTEGAADMSVMNYLTGFRFAVADGVKTEVRYTVAETNSYFGVIVTSQAKTVKAKIEPISKPQTKPQTK